jgi:hypothetical protein
MPAEVSTAIVFLITLTLWMAAKHAVAVHQATKQREIAQRGVMSQGRVVAIQRPFLLDDCTRLYFEFLPDGMDREVRACHVDRRAPDELRASLPAQGALVSIRYLPEQPHAAVIGKLVA